MSKKTDNNDDGWIVTNIPGRTSPGPVDLSFDEYVETGGIDSEPKSISGFTKDDDFEAAFDEEDDDDIDIAIDEALEDDTDESEADENDADSEQDEVDSTKDSENQQDNDDILSPDTDSKEEREAKGKKATRRIQQLSRTAKAAEDEATELRNQLQTMRKEKLEVEKSNLENQKTALDDQISNYKRLAAEAMDTGQTEEFLDFQSKLNSAAVKKMSLEAVKYDEVETPVKAEQARQQVVESAPTPEAIAWVKKNGKVLTKPGHKVAAWEMNDQLIREGWDDQDPEFYTELTERLGEDLPAFKGRPKRKTQAKRSTKNKTVAGTSRNTQPRKNPNLPRLTDLEKSFAREFGMTETQWAMQKAHNIKSEENSSDGYIPVKTVRGDR